MRTLETEVIRYTTGGLTIEASVAVIPDDASPALREGLRRRRVAAGLGRCPCGATRQVTSISLVALLQADPDRPGRQAPFNHAADCPAHDDLLTPEVARWKRK